MAKRGDKTWQTAKRAQLHRALTAMPGLQTSVIGDDMFLLRYSTDHIEEAMVVGKPDTELIRIKEAKDPTKRKAYIVTIPGVSAKNEQVDAVLGRWKIGRSAADLPCVQVLR